MQVDAHVSSVPSSRPRYSRAMHWAMPLLMAALVTFAAHRVVAEDAGSNAQKPPFVSLDAAAHVRDLTLPYSSFASPEAKAAYAQLFATDHHAPPADADIATRRAYYDRFNSALARRAAEIYPVRIENKLFGAVRTEVITPKEGVAANERDRILINLHGGAFLWGEGSGGEIESIPIASVGRITVITIAYRQGPEYKFPAASQDVATVYRSLLKDHEAKKIGIYGCSAGGILTAEALAWLQKEHLPMPGAVGIFCASANPAACRLARFRRQLRLPDRHRTDQGGSEDRVAYLGRPLAFVLQ